MRVIDDLETLKLISEPTRAAILESLAEPRSVTELARALQVPRTRLYHHIELLESKELIEQVDSRRVGPMTERIYRLTAKVLRPSARLLRSGGSEPGEALSTLLFDTTKADLRRSVASGEATAVGLGRSIAYLDAAQAGEFIKELEELVARFDAAHAADGERRPYALVWALYPSSRTLQ